ncbi:FecR domain-containing protein [Chitinophaga oryzae]|uniref:FecR domain-containing protein n=1 Tax=Chitinophaga oryzae TaxID=2725414 RepID=A0AAE6ZHX6_9BACT|nr:FecR domain-containing protein [Chitinophaga oryzae]QJB32124.1 FecR domain-containing protein [Chitinophaga oryzae]QJB38600.1 FecR domain-containing protein [Chitinophaga oryzae]
MKEHPTELLKKFLDNRCSPEELEQVQQLLQLPENSELLDRLMAGQSAADWEHTGYADEQLLPTVERWKAQLNERIRQQSGGKVKQLRARRLRNIAAVMAGILVLSGISYRGLKNKRMHPAYVEQRNPGGAPVRYLLPDSTQVHLAAGSRMRYPAQFSGSKREVFLEGEAFFDVKQDAKNPFIIRTGDVYTEVLGTSFRITAFEAAPLEVAVASGKVQVTDPQKGQLAVLTKGRVVSYNAASGVVEQHTVDPSSLEKWTTGEVYFEETHVDRIAEELQRIYGVKIRFQQPALATIRVSAAFSASEPVAGVMQMLAFVGKFQYNYDSEKKLYTLYVKNQPMDKR